MNALKKTLIIGVLVLLTFSTAMAQEEAPAISLNLDKTVLNNGGDIIVSGKAPAGKPVFIEVWAEQKVKASRFDSDPDKETGKRPYILYLTEAMPAYYKIFMPKDRQPAIDAAKNEGKKWSFSKTLKETGADAAYSAPGMIAIDRCQASLMGSIIGSRGDMLCPMDASENKKSSMQLVKARFRSPEKIMGADVDMSPDGTFTAHIKIRKGLAPGKYMVAARVDKDIKSRVASFENTIKLPNIYLSNAGTSLNLLGPFFLTLAVSIFGVLMGAGGGFILNPLLLSIWPLPHTIVAGTVMPTVLFSQGSGIYNYSKIKFIHWKLGISIGLAMLAGSFIGPKLTELITLDQFKFVFGWILIVLAALMFWQTTPGYLEKNKKEQAILKEFKKKAEEAAKTKACS
ncbi:MAG: sulfite exporter TauE/SafE family protein [Desulfobacteraceae bacterium]|nr:MAG: sulfite exporter TauE/SafE family protein [Desulfobacteraceae bacterium]